MESIKQLRIKCRKNLTPEQWKMRPWFTEKVTRCISTYLTWFFLWIGLSANHVSCVVFLSGVCAGVLFVRENFLVACLVLQIWYLIDAVDGEIARYHGVDDLTGDYSDKVMHYVIEAWVFYAVGLGLASMCSTFWIHYLGLWVAFFFTVLKLIYDLKYKCFVLRAHATGGNLSAPGIKSEQQTHAAHYWLQKIVKTYSLYPNVMNVITFCVIVDIFWPGFHWIGIRWTALILIMISYSFFYPAACFKSYYTILRYRGIDREFKEMLVPSATDLSND